MKKFLCLAIALFLISGCSNKMNTQNKENPSEIHEESVFQDNDLELLESDVSTSDFSTEDEMNNVFESASSFPYSSKKVIIETSERLSESFDSPESLERQIEFTKKILTALQDDFNNQLKTLPNDDERYEILKDYFKKSYSFLNANLIIAENYQEKRVMNQKQEKEFSEISNDMDSSFKNMEYTFAKKGTPLKEQENIVSPSTNFSEENFSDNSNLYKEKSYSVQFSKDRLAFKDFSVDPYTAKIEVVNNAPVLIFEFDWYNQSFPKTTTFLSAGSIDAFQGDTLLEQLDTSEGNMVRKVPVGSAATVEVKFKLLDTEQPIKINFVDNQSGGQEVKSVTLTTESR